MEYHSMTDSFEDFEEYERKVENHAEEELMVSCESLHQLDEDRVLKDIHVKIKELLQEVRELKQAVYRMEQNDRACTTM